MRTCVTAIASVLLVCLCSTTTWSNEADELREKAESLQRVAKQLSEQGHQEEAQKLSREAKELMRAAQKHSPKDRPGVRKGEMQELEQRLKGLAEKEQALKTAGNKEGLADLQEHRITLERELKAMRQHFTQESHERADNKPKQKHGGSSELDEAARRIKHVRVAAENLRAAGLRDAAAELDKQAEQGERDLRQAHEQLAKKKSGHEPALHSEELSSHVAELRREVQQLRNELRELREELKRRQ